VKRAARAAAWGHCNCRQKILKRRSAIWGTAQRREKNWSGSHAVDKRLSEGKPKNVSRKGRQRMNDAEGTFKNKKEPKKKKKHSGREVRRRKIYTRLPFDFNYQTEARSR